MLMGRSYGGIFEISSPLSKILPEVGNSKPANILSSVDLPQPELPSKAKISPLPMSIDTLFTAAWSPNFLTTFCMLKYGASLSVGGMCSAIVCSFGCDGYLSIIEFVWIMPRER